MSVSPEVAAVAAPAAVPDRVVGSAVERVPGPDAGCARGRNAGPDGMPHPGRNPGDNSGSITGSITGLVAGRVAFSTVDGPGKRYVLRLQGCTFDCLACAHPAALVRRPIGLAPRTVDDVVVEIAEAAPYLTGVTVSGGEPTLQADFVHALLCRLATQRGTRRLTRFVESNGDADPQVWELLAPVTDGFMVDLKAWDDETHVVLTGQSNVRVLQSIRTLAGMGLLYEVRLLPIPGINDSDDQLEAVAAWLLSVDPSIRVRVNEFHRMGTRQTARDLLRPRRTELVRYRHVLNRAGITDLVVP